MVKKVFAIIGIVFGSVAAFVGAVFGVMAAMGKFKTPVVYPTALVFLNNDEVVVENISYGNPKNEKPTIHSFYLQGSNSSSKHEVNKTICYIWFENNVGSNLITLCDKAGTPLQRTSNNRYKVNCNEPIYYMINEVADNEETDGKVVIMARSENDKVQPDDALTIWIDREVESVFVKDSSWTNAYWNTTIVQNSSANTQNISLGVDIPFSFEYVVDTPLSLKPISKESAKEIELYYVATGYSADYLKVTEDEIDNPNSPLNSILSHENGIVEFKSNVAGNHTFKIAIFSTYQAKTDYEASIEGLTINNPNYHRTTEMTLTTLNVHVEDIEISEVGFLGGNVVLNLYSQNDYITLDGVSGVEGAKNNNLELFMKKGDAGNAVLDYTRFDEVNMNGFVEDVWSDRSAMFKASETDLWTYEGSFEDKTVLLSEIHLANDLTVIDYVYNSADVMKEKKYFASNGVAVWDNSSNEIKLLSVGSYLNFYIQKQDGSFSIANFKYSVSSIGSGKEKSWNIVCEEMPKLETGEKLVLGILVVNNSGEFKSENYFKTIDVSLNEVDFEYQLLNNSAEIDITFSENVANYDSKPFDYFVNVKSGSYNASVLVIEDKDESNSDDKYIVDAFDNIKFTYDDKHYVVVGFKDDQGKFVNAVRVNSNVTKDEKSCQLFMLQLKNGYQETVNDIFDNILVDGKVFASEEIVELHDDVITINSKYIMNAELLSYQYYDVYDEANADNNVKTEKVEDVNVYEVYENTENHVIVISSSNVEMMEKLFDFYQLNTNMFKVNYSAHLTISDLKLDKENGKWIVTYNAENCLSDDSTIISTTITGLGEDVYLAGIRVLSGSPDQIVLNDGNGNTFKLFDSQELARESTKYLEVVVKYELGKYSYSFKLNNVDIPDSVNIFNDKISKSTDVGFQDETDKGQTFEINYESLNTSIFNTTNIENLANKTDLVKYGGETVLNVTIREKTQYIKVVVNAQDFALSTFDNATDFENKTKLSDMVSLKYKEDQITNLTTSNLVFIKDVKCISYGDGVLMAYGDISTGWKLMKNADDTDVILSIDPTSTDWTFTKANPYVPLTIEFVVQTVGGDKTIELTFTSSISISVNNAWQENRTLYAGTKVVLRSLNTSEVPVFDITGIADNTTNIKFNFIKNQTVVKSYEGTGAVVTDALSDELIGNISIEVLIAGTKTTEFGFDVKPNVIATQLKTNFESGSTNSIESIYKLQKYNTLLTYGESEDKLYSTTVSAEDLTLKNLTDLIDADLAKLSITTSASESSIIPTLTGGSSLVIDPMQELKVSVTKTIYLSYEISEYESYNVCENLINITNKYDSDDFTLTQTGENETLTFKAMEKYSQFASVTGFELINITADNLTFDIDKVERKFKVLTIVEQTFESVDVKLTFEKGVEGQEGYEKLTYSTQIDVIPYSPNMRSDIATAYSGSTYDLLNGIYNANDESANDYIVEDENIEALFVTKVCDEKGNNITSEAVDGALSGYTKGSANPNSNIVFKEIAGSSKKVWVWYTITYAEGKSYSYSIELTIWNRQTIVAQYPESDLFVENSTFKFVDGHDADALAIMGGGTISSEGIYVLGATGASPINYEPILIYTNKYVDVNFKHDDVKKISRVKVENVVDADKTQYNTSTNLKEIELIAYQNNPGMASYASRVIINDDNQISLPSATQGMFGSLVFKLTTYSGNVAYYVVYVYCMGSGDLINAQNNLKIIAYDETYQNPYSASGLTKVKIEDDTTYEELLTLVLGPSSIFGVDYSADLTTIYLYEGISTGADFNYNKNNWTRIESDEIISLNARYNEVTIGLVYKNGVQIYPYGTITLFAQPTNSVQVSLGTELSNWQYDKPNGEFTADVDSNATQITCPFGAGWTAEIVSVNGLAYDSAIHTNYGGTSNISIEKRVGEDTVVKVKYSNNGTITFVEYTHKATILPTQEYLDSHPITIGEFKNDAFQNTIEVSGNKFLGTYGGDIVIIENDDDISYDEDLHTLEFDQTTEQQIKKVTIEYSNYVEMIEGDEEGEQINNNTRTFTFIVEAGVHLDDTSNADESGLTNAKRINTTLNAYDSNVGSTLSVDYTAPSGSVTHHKYQIGDLIIYTVEESKLNVTFGDNYNYVVNGGNVLTSSADIVEITGDGDLQFVHTPTVKTIDLTINVLKNDGGAKYIDRKFYVNAIQTYTSLKSTYIAEGADHENVVSDSKNEDLHNDLFSSSKMSLVGALNGTTINLENMGFGDKNNPNYVEFSVTNNANIRTYGTEPSETVGIKFATVSKNTVCTLIMNNKVGMPECYYDYQIMAGTNVDGLTYSTSNDATKGIYKDEYITYLLVDINNETDNSIGEAFTSKKYVIGTMKDLNNENIFSISELKIGSSVIELLDTPKKTIVDGKYEGDATTKVVGEYQNGIQYIVNYNNYTFYITYDNDNNKIELIVFRAKDKDINDFVLRLSAGGVNGGSTLIDGLKIVLTNTKVDGKFETTSNDATKGVYKGEYITYLLVDSNNETDKSIGEAFTSKKYVIGTMKDLNNENIFSISELKIDTSFIDISGVTKRTIVDGKYEGDATSKVVGEYQNGIQYIVEKDNYIFYITYDNDNKKIELIVSRIKDKDINDFVLRLSAGGVNGGSTLIDGLKIVLTNTKVSGKFETTYDQSVYADDLIDLSQKINVNGGSGLSYSLMKSTYSIMGDGYTNEYTIEAGDNDNNLFTFNPDDKTLQTRPVGSTVCAEIEFEVKNSSGYVIDYVKYNFYVYLNMQLLVNAESLDNISGRPTLETNLVIDADGKEFKSTSSPVRVQFIDKEDFDETNNYETSTDRYNVLVYELYRLRLQGNDDATEDEKLMAKNNVKIEIDSNISSDIVKIVKENGYTYLEFYKDYTGDIDLKLSVQTDNDTYYEIWTLHVTGVITLNYAKAQPETDIIKNNSISFNSGMTVDMINNTNKTDVGIVMSKETHFNHLNSGDVKVNYEYKITAVNDATTVMTNEQLFTNEDYKHGGGSVEGAEINSNKLTITLPMVPSTQNEQAYFVTFKVCVEYLGITEENDNIQIFYITYQVINRQKVGAYEIDDQGNISASINVDNLDDVSNMLDLFYFEQKHGVYQLIYTDGNVQLKYGASDGDVTRYASTNGSEKIFENGYKYNVATNKLFNESGAVVVESWGDDGIIPAHKNNDSSVYSVFSSNFTNIFEFEKFIKPYLDNPDTDDIVEQTVQLGTHKFTMIEIDGSGRYGINLDSVFTGANKFDNKLEVDLSLVSGGVKTITIPAYSLTNTTGFRLYTASTITAKTNYKLSAMFLPTYFEQCYVKTLDTVINSNKTYYIESGGYYSAVSTPKIEDISTYFEISVTLSTSIIGVGTPNVNWVNCDGDTPNMVNDATSNDIIYAKINVPTGNEDNPDTDEREDLTVYNVKKVTYLGGSGDLYNLRQDFYYIDSEVVVPDYNAVGIETTRFKIAYNPDASGNVVMDLTKAVRRWYMDEGCLKIDSNILVSEISASIINAVDNVTYDNTNKKIVVDKDDLNNYKKKYPTKKNYEPIKIVLTYGSVNMACDLVFSLPEYPFVEVTKGTTEIDVVNLGLYIPVVSGGSTVYEELTGANLTKVISVIETDLGDYVLGYDSGKITLDNEAINKYFETNSGANKLDIYCRITTKDSKTLDFVITINKTT